MRKDKFQTEKHQLMDLVRRGALSPEDGVRILEFREGRLCAPFRQAPGFGWPSDILRKEQ